MRAEVFMDHQDSWHKSCPRKFGKDKLDRAQRRRDLEEAGQRRRDLEEAGPSCDK